jgi:hypothetical protein
VCLTSSLPHAVVVSTTNWPAVHLPQFPYRSKKSKDFVMAVFLFQVAMGHLAGRKQKQTQIAKWRNNETVLVVQCIHSGD